MQAAQPLTTDHDDKRNDSPDLTCKLYFQDIQDTLYNKQAMMGILVLAGRVMKRLRMPQHADTGVRLRTPAVLLQEDRELLVTNHSL